ncbi:MAG: protein-disulfide reductase DsbD domain-containing protein [Pseudolabrys sp.]
MKRLLALVLPGLALAIIAAMPAVAADTSARSTVNLIGGTRSADGLWQAGVEVTLGPGWKTYWRYPGDSGVPPKFDFEKSDNVAAVDLAWPAPHAFADGSGTSIGYKQRVVFPLTITPRDPKKPVTLRLELDYAVCEKLCVPEQAKAELALQTPQASLDPRLTEAHARIPKPGKIGDAAPLAIQSVSVTPGQKPQVNVTVAAPADTPVELFAEGPTPAWALPIPQPQPAGAAPHRFTFDLDGLPSGATAKGATLMLTVVAGDKAIEVPARLD